MSKLTDALSALSEDELADMVSHYYADALFGLILKKPKKKRHEKLNIIRNSLALQALPPEKREGILDVCDMVEKL